MVYRHFARQVAERTVGADHAEAYGGFARIKRMLIADFAALDDAAAAALLRDAFDAAGRRLGDFAAWGDMHRLSLAHPLSFAPVIGDRYRFGDYPAAGSSDTLMKTAHGPSEERHNTRYGQQARHLSDMADPDRNWFLLLGGQDGWFNSSTAFDQVALWQRGGLYSAPDAGREPGKLARPHHATAALNRGAAGRHSCRSCSSRRRHLRSPARHR